MFKTKAALTTLTDSMMYLLATPYIVQFNIINIEREENYTEVSVQLF